MITKECAHYLSVSVEDPFKIVAQLKFGEFPNIL